jgi:hypothetical protein
VIDFSTKDGRNRNPSLPKIRKLTEGLKERVGAKRRGKPQKIDSKRESEDDALVSQPSHPER